MTGLAAGQPEKRIVQASEVERTIRTGGPAEFDNCIIEGDLILSGLKIEQPVHFNDTLFEGSVKFESVISEGTANFRYSAFNGDADFWSSTFNGTAVFGCFFNGNADFRYSTFNGDAVFWCFFNGTTEFRHSAFNGNANFGNSAFNGDIAFVSSTFNGTADFWYSTFNGNADFGSSTFNGDAVFGSSTFNGDADFKYSTFNGTAYFEDSTFNDTADFIKAEFYKEASFDDSQFNGITSFNNSRFKEDALFEGTDFNCTLYLIRTKYEKMFIRWSSIKDLAYDDTAYLSIMDNFKKLGYLEDYDNCYYEYRKEHRDRDWSGKYHGMGPSEEWIRKHIDAGLEIFYGYGKKPLYPLGWAIGTVLLFGIAWWIGGLETHNDKSRKDLRKGILEKYGFDKKTVPKKQSIGRDWRREIEILTDAMIFSATIFLSGTRLFIEPPVLPDIPRWSKSTTKFVFTAERVLGAFFSILFFLAIGATVIR